MKIDNNFNYYNNCSNQNQKSQSFKKLEQVEVYGLMKKDGEIKKNITDKLNSSPFFQELCKRYDVIVKMGTKRIMGGYESACEIFYKQPAQMSEKVGLKSILSYIINPFRCYQNGTVTSSSVDKNLAESKIAEICMVPLYNIKSRMKLEQNSTSSVLKYSLR